MRPSGNCGEAGGNLQGLNFLLSTKTSIFDHINPNEIHYKWPIKIP